jgi:tRNA-2-methylthio-N6-dimethylallyladenosine synthase
MKFFVETFGCQMNAADSQEMSRRLMARGFLPTERSAEADCILVNTCTVREHAEHRALSYLGRLADWKNADARRVLVLTGCAAERMGEQVRRRFPQVSLVVGAKSIDRFDELLNGLGGEVFDARRENASSWAGDTKIDALLSSETVSAFVTIMRGCNYSCSYCIVPSVRGREVYRPAASLLSEVRQKAALGLKEVMLLGQTVNSYRPTLPNPGPEGKDVSDFADLLRAVDAVPGVRRIRFMSPHPFYVNDRFVSAMAESPNVCRHLHLPAQSGADGILSRMRRNYTRGEYLHKVQALRRAMPDLAVTTDLIVGFPGETEADFQATLSLVSAADFDGGFLFKYSPRPGTASASWTDDVPEDVKEERHARLLEAVEALSTRKVAARVGSRLEALVEPSEKPREGIYEGRVYDGRKVFFTSSTPLSIGSLPLVEITGVRGRVLEGRAA